MRQSFFVLVLLLTACGRDPAASLSTPADSTGAYSLSAWELPPTVSGAQPDLVATTDGRLLLSWIESGNPGTHTLKLATFDGKAWSAPQEIAHGDNWFVNWADTPHVTATGDGALWAHWLRQSAQAAYAYDVVLSRSADGGRTWSAPIKVNDDGTPTEHGFVSLWPQSKNSIGVAWLDGRNTAGGGHGEHDAHAGAMSLRAAVFGPALERSDESELDPRTCDCCQTDAAMTARGPLLVYRDRDGNEIRDIVTTRFDDGAWTLPRKVHDDRWKMPACPVNGPAVAAQGTQAWVAWYTAAGDTPRLRLARSQNAGDDFLPPVEVDSGAQVQGRVGIAVADDSVWVSWAREDGEGQTLWLVRHDAALGKQLQRIQVAKLQGRGRATGFAQLAVRPEGAYLVWTDVVDGKPQLQGARVLAKTR
jgi:hypothetical protein